MWCLSWIASALMVVASVGCKHDGGPQGPFRMRNTPTAVKLRTLVAETAAPTSVALAPDATKLAYTTARGELFVRPLAARDATPWPTTGLESPVAIYVAGMYSDGSLAVLSTTASNAWRLHRVRQGGGATLLHAASERLHAAVSAVGDRTFIATASTISEVLPSGLRTVTGVAEDEDRILAIAISPDGTRIANMRDVKYEVTEQVHVTTVDGRDLGWQQRIGSSPGYGRELLAWIDNERFVFAGGDASNEAMKTQIYATAVTDGLPETRDVWEVDAYVGAGSAAKGVLVVVRGTAAPSVVVADPATSRPGAPVAGATNVAGWTAKDELVTGAGFWREERVMRGAAAWPGTRPGDTADAVVGDAVIVHRMEGNGLVVDRLDAAGQRKRLAHVSLAESRWRPRLVRCAGERAAPCVIEHVEYGQTQYIEIDPATGARGPVRHTHAVRYPNGPTPDVALSPDGKLLVVVDQSPRLTLVANGKPTIITLEGVGAIDAVSFGADDAIWLVARDARGQRFAVLEAALDREAMTVRIERVIADATRGYTRAIPSRDGRRLALGAHALRAEITRVDGL